MKIRTLEWFARQLAHAQAAIREADKVHTPEELAAAEAALAIDPRAPQGSLPLPTSAQPKQVA